MQEFLQFDGGCPPRFFFFDTETTGLPRNWKASLYEVENWPRMVQLAWMMCDEQGNELASASHIIQPDGYTIPDGAARVHGITTERALAEGRPLREVVREALVHIAGADHIVAHNISFDEKILGAECLRLGLDNPFLKKNMRCTMREATDWCMLPGRNGYKFPNLGELHRLLFGRGFSDAHNAFADVRACKAAYYELRRIGVMK
ncbi:MAG: 3'-5' exonuclease [Verrucomicrobiota bacterium]|jgi:DNA polymerase III epsilon subunit-like protein|nr:3'-5' exonuclease [Verrucomicrobiota bacterium]